MRSEEFGLRVPRAEGSAQHPSPEGRAQPYRVALLLPGNVLVDVLVPPVKHQLLLLSLVHPHDGPGDFLDDALKLA